MKGIDELISSRFGSKRGFLRYWQHHPAWRRYPWAMQPSRPMPVSRLVFICQGNVCRSAMAVAVAEQLGIPAVSYGLDTENGKEADPRMTKVARQLGFGLETHQATRIDRYRPAPGELLCLMEPAHRPLLLGAVKSTSPMTLLGLWHSQPSGYIHDPICSSEAYFRTCADFIRASVEALAQQTVEGFKPRAGEAVRVTP